MPLRLQEVIYKYELGAGRSLLKYAAAVIAMIGLAVWYDTTAFRNLSTQEGMDAAQLARKLSEGKGFATDFIRPFSLGLLRKHSLAQRPAAAPRAIGPTNAAATAATLDVCRLNQLHPDLANPPLYPLLLAGALKLMPFGYPDLPAKPTNSFTVYLPDLWIAMFNQLLLLVAAAMVFRLARQLFDEPVAWVSAAVFLGADLFWRFSVSGVSTLLLVILFLGLVEVLAKLENASREPSAHSRRLFVLAGAAGVLAALGGLTRYAFGWLIVPVLFMVGSLQRPNRVALTLTAVVAFLAVMTPWLVRNHALSGAPFGTAGFAIYQNTSHFADDELERSLAPDFSTVSTAEFSRKLALNAKEIIQHDLPGLGGSWVSAFFLVGLLVPFRSPTLGRVRLFVVLCLCFLVVAQALGRTGLTAAEPDISSENLLAVAAPLAFIYGVSLLFTLLDQTNLQSPGGRYSLVGLICLVADAPLIFTLLSTSPSPIVYPPYYPPWIQEKAQFVGEGELLMTDIPWATAWYGRRQSVWLTLKHKDASAQRLRNNFYEVNSLKPVKVLYLSSKTLKSIETRSLEQWLRGDDDSAIFSRFRQRLLAGSKAQDQGMSDAELMAAFRERLIANASRKADNAEGWEQFVLGILLKSEVPTGFPLPRAPLGLLPELFLTDSEHVRGKTIQSTE
jgi:hypothetical protein